MKPAVTTLLLCLALAIAADAAGAASADGDLVIEVGKKVVDLRSADLDGDGRMDMVVLTGSEPAVPEGRGIRIYIQKSDGSFTGHDLPDAWVRDAFLVDLGEYSAARGVEILIVCSGSFRVAGMTAKEPRLLVETTAAPSLFKSSVHTRLVFLDSSFDLDGDGLDDAVIPSEEEYLVLREGLKTIVPIAAPEGDRCFIDRRIGSFENAFFAVVAEAGKVRAFPFPDALPLLLLESGGKIFGHRFDPAGGRFACLKSADGEFGSYARGVKVGTLEYRGTLFGDFFGTGRPDLLLSQRSGRVGILTNLRTKHTFFTMKENADTGELKLTPRQIIANEGICAKPAFSDLNADGYDDLILGFVKASILAKFLEALLDRVVITCQAFLFDPGKGTFSFNPDWSREVPVPSDCFETVGIEGLAKLDSDFSGDGRPDLVIYESDRLLFYRGESSSGLFSSREVDFKSRPFYQVAGPFPGPLLTVDVDGDGRQDIITYGDTIVRVIHVE